MVSDLRLAVIGCGGIARAHLEVMRALPARPVMTVDVDESRARQYADEYAALRHSTRIEDAFDDDVDAVIVCLPHHLHRDAVVAAAEHGKHVLTEKPMAISLQEADAMIEAAEKNRVCLMVGQVLRFRRANVLARQLIREGRIGEPRNVIRRRLSRTTEFHAEWARDPAKAGGWLLYGYGSHEVDMILWLFDTHATRVYAQGRRNNPYWNDVDELSLQMELANGTMASLNHSLNSASEAWDTILTGTAGSMYVANERIVLNEEEMEVPMGPAMERQLREFVDAIAGGREPEASGANVRRTMQALEAAKLSLTSGQVVSTEGM
jgi:UDP-N-acetylglucosamine 3-dehydrogenase